MSIIDKLPYEWVVGLRYTRAGRRSGGNRFISFISLISMAGIGLGVAALIVVLSVMNGFEKEVTARMLSMVAHIEIYDARTSMPNWRDVIADAMKNPEVKGAAPFIDAQAMLINDDQMRPAVVRGILPDEERKVSQVMAQIKQGSFAGLTSGSSNIVLGIELARALHVKVGDKLSMAYAKGALTSTQVLPQLRSFTVTGVFEAGHYEFDSSLAFVHLDDAAQIEHLIGPTGLRLRVADLQRAPDVAHALAMSMKGDLLIRDWSKSNANWFAAVRTQKHMMFIILALIIAVAAFNLVSTLVMTVTDKHADIAILRTIGASPRSIMKIFLIQGALVGLMGTAFGVGCGVLVALNIGTIVPFIEHLFGVSFLAKDIYLISAMPSDLRWLDVANIGGVAVALAFVATLYPSWSAARVKPAQALRYE